MVSEKRVKMDIIELLSLQIERRIESNCISCIIPSMLKFIYSIIQMKNVNLLSYQHFKYSQLR